MAESADPESQRGETEKNPPQPAASPAPAPTGSAASSAPSFQPTRPLYIPQFTAATQMILKRMKGEPSSLSAALSQASRSPSVTASIPSATYEDVKRRLVLGINTSSQMTVQMPAAPPVKVPPSTTTVPPPRSIAPRPSSTVGMSAIRKVTAGLTASSKPTPIKPAIKPAVSKIKTLSSESKIKKTKPSTIPRGPKRKRTKSQAAAADDDLADDAATTTTPTSASSSIPSTPEPGPPTSTHPDSAATAAAFPPPPVPLTMTKSGRQVLKPTAYNPAAMDAASRRARAPPHHYGKRTAEQALCRRCSRMHSPAANQIVFCDGCNDGWHQRCHDPWVADDVVRDEGRAWFCRACAAKRERRGPRGGAERERENLKESWAGRPAAAKRAYLSTLPQQELVGLLMACLETHPDLPIFPASLGGDHHNDHHHQGSSSTGPRSLFAGTTTEGLFSRVEAHPTGQINYVRRVVGGGSNGGGKGGKRGSQERVNEEDEESDPLAALWPRAGMGMYARLAPDTEDDARLVDAGDFEAFSVIVYDERGRKVEENGMKV
ncbi:hypothetical protein N658DRAFT_421047 [Parathielavia hyrcaniae]|uniref:PHD-type domain-containing protein n=1 Tax=Parathielavia hyrcaniae TaxID=113614 RepID=A0AAN6T416_9PEZI|nr:hypothetical protein N658DRAFT_421047 [Parathielavia hyrcaniae]